jgi:general secretion pathway protein L
MGRLEAHAHVTTLRVFLPGGDRADAHTQLRWIWLDRRGAARGGRSTLSELPRADDVEAILPASRVLFARLKLPRVSDTTIRELLPFAVEDRLLADPAQIHAVAGRTDARGDTVVAVVDREWLERMVRMLTGAGLTVRHAWCESALVAPQAGEWHVVLHTEGGVLVDDAGVASTFDWHPAAPLPLAVRIALDEAATRGERPRVVRLHEEPSAASGAGIDPARWSNEASVPFERAEPWGELEAAAAAPAAIDLLAGDFALRRRSLDLVRVSRAALVLAGVIALLQFGFTALDTWRLQSERRTLDARREAIFRAAFPEARVVVDPDLQMARNLVQLRAGRGLASGDDFLVRLTTAARESNERALSVDYARGRLTVRRAGTAR